jgi:hypothetical protein
MVPGFLNCEMVKTLLSGHFKFKNFHGVPCHDLVDHKQLISAIGLPHGVKEGTFTAMLAP